MDIGMQYSDQTCQQVQEMQMQQQNSQNNYPYENQENFSREHERWLDQQSRMQPLVTQPVPFQPVQRQRQKQQQQQQQHAQQNTEQKQQESAVPKHLRTTVMSG